MKIQNKVIVVTGGGNGIGRELVLELLRRGARVAAVDLNEVLLNETLALAGSMRDRLSLHVLDITNKEGVEALPEKVIAAHGSVDGVINNAGIIQPFVTIKDLTYEQIQRVMHINFTGLLYMTKSFLPYLLKRPAAHIVNIGSMGGFLPVPGQTLYGASKAAVKLFTEGLNSELTETPVRVSIVFPGAIGTNIAVNSGTMTKEQAASSSENTKFKTTPAPVAAATILNGMEKDKYRILVGSDSKMMDFLYRLSPPYAAHMIYKNMRSLLPK